MFPLAVAFAGCSPENGRPTPAPNAPNLVLVVLDTVRADHLGCYGYELPTSPRIDAFATQATRFENAVSSAPWTVPSHASMFTGKPPCAHGAHTLKIDYQGQPDVRPLDTQALTLAEVLASGGYDTGAFMANTGFLAERWQLDQGFETYHLERVYADVLNERIFSWLDQREGAPFFLFVNYIDAHRPYDTRPRPEFPNPPQRRDLIDRLAERVMPGTDPVPPGLAAKVTEQYDTAIANLDEGVGALLDRLEASGLAGETIVVITSDHGEYFGEHHLVEHSKDVYQPAVGIPLLIRSPDQTRGEVIPQPVISYDLPHLVLSRFPAAMREPWLPLFPAAPGNHPVVAENYYSRQLDVFHETWGWRFRRIRRALYEDRYKLIHSSDDAHELYDLERDPNEESNLFELDPERGERMTAVLEAFLSEHTTAAGTEELPPIDPELEQQLRELGYIGGKK